MKKAPGRRAHDQDYQCARSRRLLVHSFGIDLFSHALQPLSGPLAGHRRRIGSRWRRFTCGQQVLLILAHLRCDNTCARFAASFRVEIVTACRCIREAPYHLAAGTGHDSRAEEGIRAPIDRIAADQLCYSGRKKHHGMNVPFLADPASRLIWVSDALRGVGATTAITPRSAPLANAPWPPSNAGGRCGSSAAAPRGLPPSELAT